MDKIILVLSNTKNDYEDNLKILKKLKKNCKLFIESGIQFEVYKLCGRVDPDLIKYRIYKAPSLFFIANDLRLTDLDDIKDFLKSLKEKCVELKNEVVISNDVKQNFVSGFPEDEISRYRNDVNKNFNEEPAEWGMGDMDNNEMDKSNMEKLLQSEMNKRNMGGSTGRVPSTSGGIKSSKSINRFQNCKNDAEIAAKMYGLED